MEQRAVTEDDWDDKEKLAVFRAAVQARYQVRHRDINHARGGERNQRAEPALHRLQREVGEHAADYHRSAGQQVQEEGMLFAEA